MRKIIILILFIFMSLSCQADKKINLNIISNPQAAKLLYEFELKDMEVSSEKAKELFNYDESNVHAVFYDLDSDGVDEIIGYIDSMCFYCVQGYDLFILKKSDDGYKRIAYLYFYPGGGIYILKSKTDDFFDLKVYHTRIYNIEEPKFHIKLKEAFSLIKYNSKEQYYMYFSSN